MWQIRSCDSKKTEKKLGDVVDLDNSMEWIKPVHYVHVGEHRPHSFQRRS